MKRSLFMISAALVFSGNVAFAITANDLVADYKAQGYTRIEVKTGLTQVKVEAIRGTEKREVIYDAATGAVLKSEVGTVGVFEDIAPGVSIRDRKKDFLDVGTDDDDDDDGDDIDDADDDQDDDNDDDRDDDKDDDNDDDRDDDKDDDNDEDEDEDEDEDDDDRKEREDD